MLSLTPEESSALWLSVKVAGWCTGLSLIPAVWLAWLLARKQFRGKALVDFVVNVDVLGSEGWETIEYFDCCHGHCHLHTQNSDLEPRPIAQLDSIEDVRHAFAQVEQDARDRARIIREEG